MKQEELGNEQTANNNTNPPMHSSIHAVDNKSPQTSLPALPLQKNAKEMNDLKDIFPTAKIKAILRQEERIGRIYTSAVDILGSSSAMFLKQFTESIITTTKKKRQDSDIDIEKDITITAKDIKQCISQMGYTYEFLKDTVDNDNEKKGQKNIIPNYSLMKYQQSKSSGRKNGISDPTVKKKNRKKRIQEVMTMNDNNITTKEKRLKFTDDVTLNDYLNTEDGNVDADGGALFHGDEIVEDDDDYD